VIVLLKCPDSPDLKISFFIFIDVLLKLSFLYSIDSICGMNFLKLEYLYDGSSQLSLDLGGFDLYEIELKSLSLDWRPTGIRNHTQIFLLFLIEGSNTI